MLPMKAIFKKIVPTLLLDYRNKIRYSKQKSRFLKKTPQEVFDQIYTQNVWGSSESISGQGSTLTLSSKAILMVNQTLKNHSITSILDVPCGDFNWMQHVDLSGINYLGGDLVNELILNNTKKYGAEHIRFQLLNIINDNLPTADLLVVRDCFVHFSYDHIFQALENIKQSKCKYILLTTFTQQHLNYDIVTGDWRPVNFFKKPFNFPKPLAIMEEYCPPEYTIENRGKALALWKVEDLFTSTPKP